MMGLTISPGRKQELLDASVDAGPNEGLVQIDLRFGLSCLCAGLLGREEGGDADRRGLLCSIGGIERALPTRKQHLELLDVPLRDDAGIALLQLALDVELIGGLLIVALGLLDLPFRLENVRLRRQHGGIDFGDLASWRSAATPPAWNCPA